MKFKNFMTLSCLVAATILGTSGMSTATADLNQLFQDAKAQAAQLQRDSLRMETFTRAHDLSRQSHVQQVNLIKDHINKMGQTVAQLQAARGDAGKAYQQAIDRILPPLQELASNTTAAIDRLNRNPNLRDPAYEAYLKANAKLATTLSQEVSDIVAYGDAEKKFQELQDEVSNK